MIQKHYRDIPDYDSWPNSITRVADVMPSDERVFFSRAKNSHRGLSKHNYIRKLIAKNVNQDFLDELSELTNLDYLEMETVTAESLEPLRRLVNLKTLKIDSPRNVKNFDSLLELPSLDKLFIENAKHIDSLESFAEAHHLVSLGVEGSMWTPKKIKSLRPIEGLARLEALFLTSVQLENKDLTCLATIPKLRVLECARFAPKFAFSALRQLMPDLECNWCDTYELSKC